MDIRPVDSTQINVGGSKIKKDESFKEPQDTFTSSRGSMKKIGLTGLLIVLAVIITTSPIWAKDDIIHKAVIAGDSDTTKRFIESAPNLVNSRGENGHTPLMYAVMNGHTEIVKYLLEKGANINDRNTKEGWTALHINMLTTFNRNRFEITKVLVENRADIHNRAKHHAMMPIHYAIWNDDIKALKYLISRGADYNALNDAGWTPLDYALFRSDIRPKTLKYLKKLGARANKHKALLK